MGNQVVTSRLHVDFMSELPKVGEGEGIGFGRVLGGGRFLKTLQVFAPHLQNEESEHTCPPPILAPPSYTRSPLWALLYFRNEVPLDAGLPCC